VKDPKPRVTTSRQLVVAIHDVAPPFEAQIRDQLDYLARVGIRRCVLKVVPDWHGRYPIRESPTLIALLREQVSAGSEIVLHGLQHRPHGPLEGPPGARLRGAVFAPGTAEFLSLTPDGAYAAVTAGLDCLEAAGFPRPSTFCAPGWLLARSVRASLERAGIRRIVNMLSVDDLRSQSRRWLPAVGYMGASTSQEIGIGILNALMLHGAVRRAGAVKIYLHPQGNAGSPALRRVLDIVSRMVRHGEWNPTTYAELVERNEC
jgi:predicted deacetylase